jgi:uncharacterized membrane protein YqjE
VFRHLGAYAEVAAQDFALLKSVAVERLRALVVLMMSGGLAILLTCVLIIALTWDSDYRNLVIGLMAGVFAVIAVLSANVLRRRDSSFAQPFAGVRKEWHEDRVLLQRLLLRDGRWRIEIENL